MNVEIKSITEGNQSLTNKTLDLQSQQDEIAQMQQSAVKVGSEVEALNVELGAPPRIRTIEDAVAPRTRDEKKRFAIIGMIIFGSFFGGLFGIAFLELQSQKVDSADEVPIDLGLQVVGTLPILRSRANRGGIVAQAERERPLLAEPPAGIDRRHPDHAGARGPHRLAPGGDDHQRRRAARGRRRWPATWRPAWPGADCGPCSSTPTFAAPRSIGSSICPWTRG